MLDGLRSKPSYTLRGTLVSFHSPRLPPTRLALNLSFSIQVTLTSLLNLVYLAASLLRKSCQTPDDPERRRLQLSKLTCQDSRSQLLRLLKLPLSCSLPLSSRNRPRTVATVSVDPTRPWTTILSLPRQIALSIRLSPRLPILPHLKHGRSSKLLDSLPSNTLFPILHPCRTIRPRTNHSQLPPISQPFLSPSLNLLLSSSHSTNHPSLLPST